MAFLENLNFKPSDTIQLGIIIILNPKNIGNNTKKNSLSNRNDSDSDCDELSDGEISKLLIVTQTPNRPRKHEGFDRTGDFCSRVKLSQDLAQVINDGLSYYEVILILVNINTTF